MGKEKLMSVKIYVGNISFKTTNQDLSDLFAKVGTVESCDIIEDRETGRSRGFGFVIMSSKAEAENAIAQLDRQDLDGRELKVNRANLKKAPALQEIQTSHTYVADFAMRAYFKQATDGFGW